MLLDPWFFTIQKEIEAKEIEVKVPMLVLNSRGFHELHRNAFDGQYLIDKLTRDNNP